MLTIEGTYKDGKVLLSEFPIELHESRVLVTFLQSVNIDLSARGIDREQAAELRGKFNTIAEDWEAPEMDVYDVD
ncbi:MAG TPA: hypothetical protein VK612_06250 [Pyrinomonadaceae bacterium]|nr:hypothetical protein [Pyrinomonadaceae bacterium]